VRRPKLGVSCSAPSHPTFRRFGRFVAPVSPRWTWTSGYLGVCRCTRAGKRRFRCHKTAKAAGRARMRVTEPRSGHKECVWEQRGPTGPKGSQGGCNGSETVLQRGVRPPFHYRRLQCTLLKGVPTGPNGVTTVLRKNCNGVSECVFASANKYIPRAP
jgi:hypothetical protein